MVTGNLVLLGVALARHSLAGVVRNVVVVPAYAGGLAAAAYLGRRAERNADRPSLGGGGWPGGVRPVFVLEAVAEPALALGWVATGGHPSDPAMIPLIVLSALSMGLQSGAARRLGVAGLSTTYFTGTLTHIVTRLAAGDRLSSVGLQAASTGVMVAGAVLGAVAADGVPAAGCLPWAFVATAPWIGGYAPRR